MINVLSNSFKIVQVGCGGTGGYLVPHLARLLITLKEFKNFNYQYILADFDLVEEINLYRQNFIKKDEAQNKAFVLAQRYSLSLGADIAAIDINISSSEQLWNLFKRQGKKPWARDSVTNILIGCVDNTRARRIMHEYFKNFGQSSDDELIYIDSGNGKYHGQIVIGYKRGDKEILPPAGVIFPDLLEEEESDNQPANCALNALQNPQNIAANIFASTTIFGVLNQILTNQKIYTHIINFDSEKQVMTAKAVQRQDPKYKYRVIAN